jgi:ribose transport system permease protein
MSRTVTNAEPAPQTEAGAADQPSSWYRRLMQRGGTTLSVLIVLLLILAWCAVLNPSFLKPTVLLAFVRRAAPLMVAACGELFVIVAGGYDLSIGALVTMTVVLAAGLMAGDPSQMLPVATLLFGLGAVVGLVNGFVTTRLKVPSFITTLGMLLVLRGTILYRTGGAPRGALPDNFRVFGRGGIDVPVIGQLPYAVLILVAVVGLAVVLLHRTTFGQQLYAAGGGPRAASLSGVNVPRVRTLGFVLSAVFAVVAGVLLAGISGVSAQVGEGFEFSAISAVVLGGAVLGGGKGSMVAVALGALTLEALFTLLNLLGLPTPARFAAQGLIIIGAVVLASYRQRKSG